MVALGAKLNSIDLNLLVVFDALMLERNVTRAARRLALSQPTLSHALGRLRHMLKDELFIRSPRGMIPTPRAEQLASPVRRALDELQRSLEPPQFDPSSATKIFRVAVDNYAAIVLVAPVAMRIAKMAPGVTLDFCPSGTLNVHDLLDRGQLDLAIGSMSEQGERFAQQQVLEDRFVAVLRRNHEVGRTRKLTLETLAALPHLEISSSLQATDFVDRALSRSKLVRQIAFHAPFLSTVRLLAGSDAIAVLPRRVAREMTGYRLFALHELPFTSPAVTTTMIWPRWLDNEPAHRWLRDTVGRTAKSLTSD